MNRLKEFNKLRTIFNILLVLVIIMPASVVYAGVYNSINNEPEPPIRMAPRAWVIANHSDRKSVV